MKEKELAEDLLILIREKLGQENIADDDAAMELIVQQVFHDPRTASLSLDEIRRLIRKLFYKTRRKLGILQPLMEEDGITEIMVNGPGKVFVEKNGAVVRAELTFDSTAEIEDIMRNIASQVHREINEMNPIVDARLPDGSRVNGVYKNIAVNGPILTIRRFSERFMTLESLVRNDTIPEEGGILLSSLVACGYNIFISGGTSSGKTTFLNALAAYIPKQERVIVIEDSSELKLRDVENIVHLECRESNLQGKGKVEMSRLIRSSLRMRPDRIIVGEVRGPEVLEMFQAMNSGHSGSMSTGHGNSVEGMLQRLETMYLMAMPLGVEAIRTQIGEAIDIMVHVERMEDGRRRVTEIVEIAGYHGGKYRLIPLMKLNEANRLEMTGQYMANIRKIIWKGGNYADQLRELEFIR